MTRTILSLFFLLAVIACKNKGEGKQNTHVESKSLTQSGSFVDSTGKYVCADTNASFLWTVEGKSNKVHLFGTVHVGKPSFYPFVKKVEDAFSSSKYLVLELDPNNLKKPEVQAKFNQMGILPKGKTLQDVVEPEVFNLLDSLLKSLSLSVKTFERQKPWMAAMMTQMIQMGSLGYNPNQGVEFYFIQQKKDGSNILELESIEEQLSLFENMDGSLLLKHTLVSRDSLKAILDELLTAWKCGEKEKVHQAVMKHMKMDDEELQVINNKLLFERNKTMASRIKKFLEEGTEDYFVAVGAAHLIGEKSVIDYLDQLGYKAE